MLSGQSAQPSYWRLMIVTGSGVLGGVPPPNSATKTIAASRPLGFDVSPNSMNVTPGGGVWLFRYAEATTDPRLNPSTMSPAFNGADAKAATPCVMLKPSAG